MAWEKVSSHLIAQSNGQISALIFCISPFDFALLVSVTPPEPSWSPVGISFCLPNFSVPEESGLG